MQALADKVYKQGEHMFHDIATMISHNHPYIHVSSSGN